MIQHYQEILKKLLNTNKKLFLYKIILLWKRKKGLIFLSLFFQEKKKKIQFQFYFSLFSYIFSSVLAKKLKFAERKSETQLVRRSYNPEAFKNSRESGSYEHIPQSSSFQGIIYFLMSIFFFPSSFLNEIHFNLGSSVLNLFPAKIK